MSFEFTENVTFALPNISEKVKTLNEANGTKRNKIITEIAAIHVGLTANFNMYTEEALSASIESWISPYPRPIIKNHDETTEPLGRVMAAKMDKEADGTPYIAIQAAIISPDAVEKVLDDRYITGSVGGRADSAKCSICNIDWAKESGPGIPCRHKRGKVYEGKLAYFELGEITWREYSFVNVPADDHSQLKAVNQDMDDLDDSWVRPIEFYSLDMDEESILKLSESDSDENILDRMKRADAAYTYRNVKGTFLTTTAFDLAENNTNVFEELEKENAEKFKFIQKDTTIESETVVEDDQVPSKERENMEKTDAEVQEDILSVAEDLRADSISEGEEVPAEENKSSDEQSDDGELAEGSDQEADPLADSEETTEVTETEEISEETEVTEEEETSEVEAKEEEASETEQNDESLVGSEAEEAEDAVSNAEEGSDEKVDEEIVEEAVDSEKEELQSEVERLQTENAKLRASLHYMLAERVVDAKISNGLVDPEKRADAIVEHEGRTPSSLADALKDLQEFHAVVSSQPKANGQTMNVKSHAVSGESSVDTEGEEVVTESDSMSEDDKFELYLYETLMGQRSL